MRKNLNSFYEVSKTLTPKPVITIKENCSLNFTQECRSKNCKKKISRNLPRNKKDNKT